MAKEKFQRAFFKLLFLNKKNNESKMMQILVHKSTKSFITVILTKIQVVYKVAISMPSVFH